MGRPATSSSRLAGNLLLALASTLLAVVVPELIARRWLGPVFSINAINRSHCWQRDRLLGKTSRPGCEWREDEHVVSINRLGLRGPEVADDGRSRILVLGDSCTFGFKVTNEQTYPAVIQRLLDGRGGPTRFQVLNAGFPGYTSYEGLLYLRERGLAFHPAIVLFGFGWTDSVADGDVVASLAYQRRFYRLFTLTDWLGDYSTLVSWLVSRSRLDLPARASPARFEENLEEIVRLTREAGAEPMAVSFSATQLPPYHDPFVEVTTRLGVPVVEEDGPGSTSCTRPSRAIAGSRSASSTGSSSSAA